MLGGVTMVLCLPAPQVSSWHEVMEDLKRGVHLAHVSSTNRNTVIRTAYLTVTIIKRAKIGHFDSNSVNLAYSYF